MMTMLMSYSMEEMSEGFIESFRRGASMATMNVLYGIGSIMDIVNGIGRTIRNLH